MRVGVAPWPEAFAARYRERDLWRGVPLGVAFAERAERTPSRVALVDGEQSWRYGDLAEAVDLLAERLARHHGPGEALLVQLPNVAEFVVLTLACFRVGVVPVMALPQHRRGEIGYLLAHSEASGWAVSAEFRGGAHLELVTELAAGAPALRQVWVQGGSGGDGCCDLSAACRRGGDLAAARSVISRRSPGGSDAAVLLLSGGTTGRAKLIARSHDDYALNARLTASACEVGEDTVYLVALPAAHNFALACPGILGVLLSGGTVVLSDSPAPEKAFGLIERHRATHTAVVPAVAHRWAEHAGGGGHDLSSLRSVAVGGSRLAPALARRLESSLGARVQQGFGMAEGLINYTRLDDPDEVRWETQGRPVCPADEVRIVDELDRDVPGGAVGELLTRGPYTIRGYFRAPEHNAASFTRDGWYRTGDLVRWHPTGNLVVEGRRKDVINRGGEKVSAEEVEELALGHPDVARAAAVAAPDPVLGERVCLYVVPRGAVELTVQVLREHMTDAGAAGYKLPELLHTVPELPVTNVGKIDKNALRADAAARARGSRPDVEK
ncbi:(2,3-dihydroxybenzoyl)adenylate synthase [Pseudonocardia acaciae]|uniref:(2,3-dihydroxybenzoyl)adenylate synthase n=1 Tax=Pseudonocardia acaciae TaxID=551276 RepID=UPI0005632F8B|nr:AMP-binding protein [Pseudonocardia acaciae]